ncbi:hypothetical protein BGZ92_006389 [Podila epicladia]|nr:hypothetical protein BGZ92_006389 [Podila epicladia]
MRSLNKSTVVRPLGSATGLMPNVLALFEQIGLLAEIEDISRVGLRMEVFQESLDRINRVEVEPNKSMEALLQKSLWLEHQLCRRKATDRGYYDDTMVNERACALLSQTLHPLLLPEIVQHVALFLSRLEMTTSMMVCHTWHSTLVPIAWREFSWYSPAYRKRNPDDAQILKNTRHIQALTIHSPAGPTTPLLSMASHLTRLTSIRLPFLSSDVLQVIQLCRETLVGVGLVKMDGPSGQIFNHTSSEQLTTLHLGILRPGTLPPISGYPPSGFPRMRHLSVHTTIPEVNLVLIAHLFARCAQATRLKWQAGYHRLHDREYAKAIRDALEPLILDQLEELTFDMDLVQDATVARMLPKMPRLRSLSLEGRTYAYECHTALVLAPTRTSQIVELDLSGCFRVSSRMIQEILTTCTELVAFKGPLLDAYSMVEEASKHPSPATLVPLPAPAPAHLLLEPWVCRNLERFEISMDHLGWTDEYLKSPGAASQMFYSQLARLTRLRWVRLHENLEEMTTTHFFRMSCATGLEQLAGWTKIQELDIRGLGWLLEVEDVRWMVETWPELEKLYVRKHQGEEEEGKLEEIQEYLDELLRERMRRVVFVTKLNIANMIANAHE